MVTVLVFQTPVKQGRRGRLRGFQRLWPWTQMMAPPPSKWSPTQAHQYNRWRRVERAVPQRWWMLCPLCTKESGTWSFGVSICKVLQRSRHWVNMCSVTNCFNMLLLKAIKVISANVYVSVLRLYIYKYDNFLNLLTQKIIIQCFDQWS